MTNKVVLEYADQIPNEVRMAFTKGLSDDTRIAILVFLDTNGQHSFKQLKERLNMNESTLNYHLNKLSLAGLVVNYYSKMDNVRTYSRYDVTPFAKMILKQIRGLFTNFVLKPSVLVSESVFIRETESEVVMK